MLKIGSSLLLGANNYLPSLAASQSCDASHFLSPTRRLVGARRLHRGRGGVGGWISSRVVVDVVRISTGFSVGSRIPYKNDSAIILVRVYLHFAG